MANFEDIRDILNNPTDHNLPEWTNGQNDITGVNLQGYLSMLLSGMESADDFFNVNNYNSEDNAYQDAAEARGEVPTNVRKVGLVIAYKLSDGWFIDQFIGSNISGWGTASNWKALGPVSVSQDALTTDIKVGNQTFNVANGDTVEFALNTNRKKGKLIVIADNKGKEISITGSENYHICGKNLFNQSSLKSGYIKNDSGIEVADASSSYFTHYIPVCTPYDIWHLRANFQIQKIYCYDKEKNFLTRLNVFSDGIVLNKKYNSVDLAYIQIQMANASIANNMILINDNRYVTPAPSYEPFIENGIGEAYSFMYVYDEEMAEIQVSYDVARSIKDYLLIADENSNVASEADIVVPSHYKMQELINIAIQETDKNTIVFADDSEFVLSAPIIASRNNLNFITKGAKFTTIDAPKYSIASALNIGATSVNIGSSFEALSIGAYVEIKEGDNWDTAYIVSFDNRLVHLSKPITHSYTTSARLRNVSSAFEAKNKKGVKFRGLHIDWNYPNNERCPETIWAQNGISIGATEAEDYESSSECEVRDCLVENGGRHGILLRYSEKSIIDNCICRNWGEHGIDVAFVNTTTPPLQNHKITNNICTDNYYNGIQFHSGSGCIVENNICFNNGTGIGTLEYAHDNTFANNKCYSNNTGIAVYETGKNIIITNNIINDNTVNGVILSYADDCVISNNVFYDNGNNNESSADVLINGKTNGSVLTYCQQHSIVNNIFRNTNAARCIRIAIANRCIVEENIASIDDADVDFVYLHFAKGIKIAQNYLTGFRYVCNGNGTNWNVVNDNVLSNVTGVLNNAGQYTRERNNDVVQYID